MCSALGGARPALDVQESALEDHAQEALERVRSAIFEAVERPRGQAAHQHFGRDVFRAGHPAKLAHQRMLSGELHEPFLEACEELAFRLRVAHKSELDLGFGRKGLGLRCL